MSLNPPLRPAGVGEYTHVKQPNQPEESYVPPVPDEKPPSPRMGRIGWVVLILIVAVLVTTVTIVLLAWVVPWEYPQHVTVRLDSGNHWDDAACIPTWAQYSGPGSIQVSFNWTSPSTVDLVMVPHNLIIEEAAYNVTGTSGSGSYQATANVQQGENNVDMEFIGLNAPVMPAFVNISVSYDVPGHVLGSPSTPLTC